MNPLEKLEACPECDEVKRWAYDGQCCIACGFSRLGYLTDAAARRVRDEAKQSEAEKADRQMAMRERFA